MTDCFDNDDSGSKKSARKLVSGNPNNSELMDQRDLLTKISYILGDGVETQEGIEETLRETMHIQVDSDIVESALNYMRDFGVVIEMIDREAIPEHKGLYRDVKRYRSVREEDHKEHNKPIHSKAL